MVTAEKLSAIALHSKVKLQVNRLLGRSLSDLEELGCIAITLDEFNKFEAASSRLKKSDIHQIELWATNPSSNKLYTDEDSRRNLFKVNFSNGYAFLFNTLYDELQTTLMLIGTIILDKPHIKLTTTLCQVNQMVIDLDEQR